MPNRMIREGFLDSEKIDGLSQPSECFFVRLMLCADDFGRFDGRSKVIKARAYPLKEKLPLKNIESMLNECVKAGLIIVYKNEEKPFLQILDFKQRLRAKKSKYPEFDSTLSVICQSYDGHVTTQKNKMLEEKRREEKRSGKKFVKPTVEEIEKYCIERGNGISGQYFYDSNEAKGWLVGRNKTPMVDWKAVVRTWENNNKNPVQKATYE